MQVLAELKQALREEGHSEEGEAALCKAVHKYHFQLLLVLGSYVSLLSSLQSSSQPSVRLIVHCVRYKALRGTYLPPADV